MRKIIELKEAWNFVKTAGTPEEAVNAQGVEVTLPHTWNAVDGQDGGNDYYRGTCWYTRKIEKPVMEEDDHVYLEFLGAAMTADVFWNGEKLAHHEGGYSTFRVDVTGHLQEVNDLAVALDNDDNDHIYPQKADFTFYGGLYRMVNLIVVPQAHFDLDYAGGNGIAVTPEVHCDENRIPIGKATVTVEAWVKESDGPVTITITGVDSRQQEAEVIDGKATAVFTVENVHLWDGVKDPYLYTAKAELESGDAVETRFGCRSFYADPQKGFVLNGKVYPLRGVSRHQDRAGAGNALTLDMHREDMEIIKEIGANTLRLAHYQHAQEFYDLCDEYGMVVWAEIPFITLFLKNGRENTLSQMKELVVQNYNHPSIVCWGLSNEITAASPVNEALLENHRALNDLCHELDKTRFTTMANVFMQETDSPLLEIPDVNSYNLYFGWYLGELEQNDEFFDEYHKKYPDRCIGFSEYGADANPQYHSTAPTHGDYSETYQTIYHEHILKMIEERPYLWATHVWNMFDFAADGRDEGGAHGVNQKGLVTMDRQVKKDAFYLYKAHWSREPFVHLCGRRYRERAEAVTEIKVYTNAPQVELYVDGVLFAAQGGKPELRFRVPLSGQHRIEAIAGQCRDEMCILRVDAPNPSYIYGSKGGVTNWFDKEDFRPGYFSVKDTMAQLQAHDKAGAIVGRMMDMASASRGDVAQSVKGNPDLQRMMGAMTLESLLKKAGEAVTPEQVRALNQALQQIPKPEA